MDMSSQTELLDDTKPYLDIPLDKLIISKGRRVYIFFSKSPPPFHLIAGNEYIMYILYRSYSGLTDMFSLVHLLAIVGFSRIGHYYQGISTEHNTNIGKHIFRVIST